MKTECLACYDYGTGGAWLCLVAASAAQIRERFPGLHVVTHRPTWLTDQEDLCVPKTSSKSCDQAILVDQGTDAGLLSDAVLVEIDRLG
jgi:hypothetical protein